MTPIPFEPRECRLTAEDLLAPGNPYERCDLWDGVAVVREPSGGWHDCVAAAIIARLHAAVRGTRKGWVVASSAGFLVARDPDRVLSPDAAFVSRARLLAFPTRGFVECAPDLAVEVRSPDDSWIGVVERAGVWIAHGVAVVWAVDPPSRTAATFRPRQAPIAAGPGDTLCGAPVLPDLCVPVDELFEGLAD